MLFYDLKKILASYDEGLLNVSGVVRYLNMIFDTLNEKQNVKYCFSLMQKYIFDNFETLIVQLFIHEKQREILMHSFQLYKKGLLKQLFF